MSGFELDVSATLGALQPSMTLGITAKAKSLKAAGRDVASMCAGEPDFDTPEHIKAAAIAALEAGDTKYTPGSGRMDLREAIAEKLRTENSVPTTADQVVVAPGAKFSVFSTIVALCSAGDEVLIPAPFWLSYAEMVTAAGAKAVIVPTSGADGFRLDADVLRGCITSATKLLILNSPSNPTGGVHPRETIETIAELAIANSFMVLADEIYERLVYDEGYEHVSIASLSSEMAERTITVNGFSKAFAMTGWRLGYAAAPKWLISRIAALQSHSTSGPTSFAQAGALVALTGEQDCIEAMRQAFATRRDRIYELLSAIPGVVVSKPRGAFYIFPDISASGLDSMSFAERLLDDYDVAVIPGKPFAADGHVRLSYACSMETIETACSRMADFCASL